MIYYYDTSSILNLQEKIFEEPFLLSSIVISELEHIKSASSKDQDVKYRARSVVRLLTENIDKFELYTVGKDACQLMGLELSNDNLILCGAIEASKSREITFVTDDLLLRLMALSHG